ncbi:MAG: TfoX/Sxy family protein [Verrucomicrobiota bacterium]
MKSPDAALEAILELLAPFEAVTSRRMFGGVGLFRESLMFALMADGILYLKADDESVSAFQEQELPPFQYQRGDQLASMDYYLCPESALESTANFRPWAELAFAAAVRKDEAKPPSKRKRIAL